jgi:uncharacterized iron-regulated membrane protein
MAHCQNVAELLDYMHSTSRAIEKSRALAAKDKKKLQKSCRAECELHMRRLTQSGVPGTSSGPSSNVGARIGAQEHMDQTAIQRNHSEARAALAVAEAAPGAAAGAMSGAQMSALVYGAALRGGDASQSNAEEDGGSDGSEGWLASLHEGSQLGAQVQGAWCKATHQGAVRMLQGKDEEKLHLLVIDGFPKRYVVCRDDKIRPLLP